MPTSTSSQLSFQIGGIWSSEAVSAFSNLCIKNAVSNVFDFKQTREVPPGWAVSLNFGFNALIGDGDKFSINLPSPFGSKKEARDAATREGLKILTKAIIKKNKESIGKETDSNGDGTENENWISLLGGNYFHNSHTLIALILHLRIARDRVLPGYTRAYAHVLRIWTGFKSFDGSHNT